MKMTDRRKDVRPREKLAAKGAVALSDYELLMAVIGRGTAQADVTKIAKDVQELIAKKGSELTYEVGIATNDGFWLYLFGGDRLYHPRRFGRLQNRLKRTHRDIHARSVF